MKNLNSCKKFFNWQITLAKIFNWCFLIAMVLVLSCSIMYISGDESFKNYHRIAIITFVFISVLIGIFLIYTAFNFFKNKTDNWNYKIQFFNIIAIIFLATVITYTVQMKYQVADGVFCIRTAKELYPTMNWHDVPFGNKLHGQYYALLRCYNMAPFIYFEALVFKFFSLFGIKLSFAGMVALGTYANTIMLLISMYLAFRLVKKYCKIPTQTGFTFLLLINIPLYATVYYVYTDIPALLTIMIILTAYDSFIYTIKAKNKIIYITVIILASIIGALFKFNVLIALFAIIIHYFLTHNWEPNIKFILLLLIPTMLGISGAKRIITTTSPIPQDELGLPAMNWINMSFSKGNKNLNGGFYNEYFRHTFKLKKENNNNNNKVNKIEFDELVRDINKDPLYYIYMLYRKIGATYNTGTYKFSHDGVKKYCSHPKMKNSIWGQILYGKLRQPFRYYSFLLQISLFFFMGIGVFQLIKQKIFLSKITPWMIALFGNMFMLLFWETCSRYLLPFVGIIYMIACVGIEQVLDARDQKKLKAKNK